MSKYFSTLRKILRHLCKTRIGNLAVWILILSFCYSYFYIVGIPDNGLALTALIIIYMIIAGSLLFAMMTMYSDIFQTIEMSSKYIPTLGFELNGDGIFEGYFRGYSIQIKLIETIDFINIIEEIEVVVFYTTDSEDQTMNGDSSNGFKIDNEFKELGYFSYNNGLFNSISYVYKNIDYELYLNNIIDFMIKKRFKTTCSRTAPARLHRVGRKEKRQLE